MTMWLVRYDAYHDCDDDYIVFHEAGAVCDAACDAFCDFTVPLNVMSLTVCVEDVARSI